MRRKPNLHCLVLARMILFNINIRYQLFGWRLLRGMSGGSDHR
jgi:hypothetical protein